MRLCVRVSALKFAGNEMFSFQPNQDPRIKEIASSSRTRVNREISSDRVIRTNEDADTR